MQEEPTITSAVSEVVDTSQDINIQMIIITIIIAIIAYSVVRLTMGKVVDRLMRSHKYSSPSERKKRHDTLVSVFRKLISFAIFITAIVIVLSQLGVNLAVLVTGLGAIGVVAGLIGQDLLKDYIKGFAIILENQFRIGDIVQIAGVDGVVEALTLRYTRLRDLDGNVHIVPNGSIDVATNLSRGYARVNLDVGVAYDTDIDLVEKVINEVGLAMDQEDEWKDIIIEPIQFLRVDGFGDSSINIKALGQVLPGEQWGAAGEFRRRLKIAFEKNDIEIPFPQHVVHQPKHITKKS